MPPNRMVALLTPIVAVAAGGAAAWLAENLGVDVQAEELQAVFIAALLAVLAPAAQWLHGSQKHERHEAELEHLALKADTEAAERAAEAEMAGAVGLPEDEDYDDDGSDDDDGEDDDGSDDDDGYYADADYDDDDDDYEAAREEQPAAA